MSSAIVESAVSLVTDAAREQLPLRILGSVAASIYVGFVHRHLKDIDVIGRRKDRARIQKFLLHRGWELDKNLLLVSELRELYRHKEDSLALDVYYGQIDGSHSIRISDRGLQLSYPAITIADLLLSKLQRHSMRDVDIQDCCLLLSATERSIDMQPLCDEACRRWGLWYDILNNIAIIRGQCASADAQLGKMRQSLLKSSKSLSWRLRSIVGRRMKWWTEIYDIG